MNVRLTLRVASLSGGKGNTAMLLVAFEYLACVLGITIDIVRTFIHDELATKHANVTRIAVGELATSCASAYGLLE